MQRTRSISNADIRYRVGWAFQPSELPTVHRASADINGWSNPIRRGLISIESSNVFKNNGQGQRGDLKAVVKAILLDPEPGKPIRVQYLRPPVSRFVVSTMGNRRLSIAGAVLNYTRFNRFFKAVAQYQQAAGGSFATPTLINNEFRLGDLQADFAQSLISCRQFSISIARFQPAARC